MGSREKEKIGGLVALAGYITILSWSVNSVRSYGSVRMCRVDIYAIGPISIVLVHNELFFRGFSA